MTTKTTKSSKPGFATVTKTVKGFKFKATVLTHGEVFTMSMKKGRGQWLVAFVWATDAAHAKQLFTVKYGWSKGCGMGSCGELSSYTVRQRNLKFGKVQECLGMNSPLCK